MVAGSRTRSKAGEWNFSLAAVDTIEAKNATTLVLNLKHADPTLLAALATFNSAILPKAAFEASRARLRKRRPRLLRSTRSARPLRLRFLEAR